MQKRFITAEATKRLFNMQELITFHLNINMSDVTPKLNK